MSVIGAAIITFFAFSLLCLHLSRTQLRRVAGYAAWFDVTIHTTVIVLFLGTSTLGLMQAELSAIMFSLSLRMYRYLFGYSRLGRKGLRLRWHVVSHGRFGAQG
jgi:hypothetical protein